MYLYAAAASIEAHDLPLMLQAYPVPAGSRPHDVAPAPDGGVWYTAQDMGELGWLDPDSGETRHIPLGAGSRPHGVIVGPDGAPWITDGGLNAIVRVDPESDVVTPFPLPPERPNANLNTATFDHSGLLWFTGQNGVYGRLDPSTGQMDVFDAPRGRGPYGIATTPSGEVYYASLAGDYVGRIDLETGDATVLEPPTSNQGARRVWSDSQSRIWVSEWDAGQLGRYDPGTNEWREWPLPGLDPSAYAVFVDDEDIVWLSDFGANALVRFDPTNDHFDTFALPSSPGNVRQLLGRPGEVWGAESAADQLVVIRQVPDPVTPGDMDRDEDVDFDDIDDFVLGLNDPANYEEIFGVPSSLNGDTDGDGDLDFDDIDPFVAILGGADTVGIRNVPEPSTWALLCLAAGFVAWSKRCATDTSLENRPPITTPDHDPRPRGVSSVNSRRPPTVRECPA
jgi:virginiamycin B lyase